MKITVNGEPLTTKARTLSALCSELGVLEDKIATARNGEFVPARQRGEVRLADGDAIEILSPRQGG